MPLQFFILPNDLPLESNSYYNVDSGTLGVYVKEPDHYELTVEDGYVSSGVFTLGDTYDSLVTKDRSEFVINSEDHLTLTKPMEIHGEFSMIGGGSLELEDGIELILHPDSHTVLYPDSNIILHPGATIKVYGKVDIHTKTGEDGRPDLTLANYIFDSEEIIIDAIAMVVVRDIELGEREYSLTDYEQDLSHQFINYHTQGEHNSGLSKIGYTWVNGTLELSSQVIDLDILWSRNDAGAILGDFKFECLGSQNELVPNIQVVRDMRISKGAALYVSESFQGYEYLRPELYFGVILENVNRPADCIVEGTLIADSPNSKISFDRGGTLHIVAGGLVDISNGAILRCTSVEEKPNYEIDPGILYIDGTLCVDQLEQLEIPHSENIVFGPKGKLVIRNKYNEEEKLLFETPNGILSSELYRIFTLDMLEHVEYHVPSNCGIRIDQTYNFYPSQMICWYANRRLEQAILDGLIVWEKGFIELDTEVVPIISEDSTLIDIAKLFKNSAYNDKERLQEVVDHMVYCGSGDIRFKIVSPDRTKSLWMRTGTPNIQKVSYEPEREEYWINIDEDSGHLFLRNKISVSIPKTLISDKSKEIELNQSTYFNIE